MSWPALQLEHLVAAVTMGWLAFACFCWSSGQRLTGHGFHRDPAWNWLAGAALLGALEFVAWLVLLQLRLDNWPDWARGLMAVLNMVHGMAAALAAWVWTRHALSRTAGWCVLLGAALLTLSIIRLAPFLAAIGWLALATVIILRGDNGLARRNRLTLGGILAVLAVAQMMVPDLTKLVLRLPSDLPLQWDSREFVSLAVNAGCVLAAAFCIWLDRPGRGRWLAAGLLAAAGLWLSSWRLAHNHAAERAATWGRLENSAAALTQAAAPWRLVADEVLEPGYVNLVTQLTGIEQSFSQPAYVWLWAVRDNMVVHVADAASLGSRTTAPKTPPGYRYPQLHNFVLRAERGERFESGPYFVAGERRVGLHVPLRVDAGPPLAWLQLSMPFAKWRQSISDPRAPALILLLGLGGSVALVLAGQSWLDAARKLHVQAVESDASARAKNEMAGLVSHELRTPLQVVLGHLEVLAATPQPPDTARTLKVIESQCRQLLGLVNDTLDLCALEAGQLAVRRVRFSPEALADATLRNFQPLATERGLRCELTIQPGVPHLVEADAARIQQILTNLLANAVKYTSSGGVQLSVGVEPAPSGRLVFTVTDSGPGLPAGVLARLGEAFQPGPSKQGTGTGLGLAIVRRLCVHLCGEFSVENIAAGGCIATVRLPAPVAAPDAPLFGSKSPVVSGTAALDGVRLVLAEDNTLVREMIADYFRNLGAEVEAVADGAAALAACRASPPDAVLLDLAMPDVDGRTVARTLRSAGEAQPAPRLIVGLSAEAIGDEEARALGFDHFFVKPVALAQLAAIFSPRARETALVTPATDRLRRLFISETPGLISALRAAIAQPNPREVARIAHYLQGSAYALANEPLRAACAALRRHAEGPLNDKDASALLRTIEDEVARTFDSLR